MINVVVITLLFLLFQLVMSVITEKIGYKLQKHYHIIGLLLNIGSVNFMLHKYGTKPQVMLLLIVVTILTTSCLIDWKYQELPDSYNLVIGILGIINLVMYVKQNSLYHVMCAVILFVIFFILAIVTGGAVGGGDIKLMGAVGLFFPYTFILKILMYGFLPGAIYALILIGLKKKSKKDMIAFGPFLVFGVILTMLA